MIAIVDVPDTRLVTNQENWIASRGLHEIANPTPVPISIPSMFGWCIGNRLDRFQLLGGVTPVDA